MAVLALGDLPRPVALVLGGGGSLGALHVGMLQVLAEAGVRPDVVIGTSVGAINGALIAERGLSAAVPELEQVWRSLRRRDVLPVRPSALRRLVGRRPVFDGSGIEHLARAHLTARTFAELDRPLVVVATDAVTGDATSFDEGALLPAITASAAIPGVFAAVKVDGRSYLDGGVSANLPVAQAQQWGAASIIALDVVSAPVVGSVAPQGEPPTSIIESALFAGGVLFRQQRREALRFASAVMPVVVLDNLGTGVQPLDFSHSSELISEGRRRAHAVVSTLSITGPGLYGTRLSSEGSAAPPLQREFGAD